MFDKPQKGTKITKEIKIFFALFVVFCGWLLHPN